MKIKTEDPSFEALWRLWRPLRPQDRRQRQGASNLLQKWIADGADPADIFDGATYHLRTMAEKDKPYINLLSVYLNSERWVDECEQERAYQARLAEIQARSATPAPKPIEQPVQAPHEDRAATAKRVFEKYGVEGVH